MNIFTCLKRFQIATVNFVKSLILMSVGKDFTQSGASNLNLNNMINLVKLRLIYFH